MSQLRIHLTSEELSILREGVITPDKWGDYPHHYGKSQEICKHLNIARSCLLNDDTSNAYLNLAIALHYIQDSYTTYPSFLPKHQEWEQWIENCYLVSDVRQVINGASMSQSMKDWSSHLAYELSVEVQGRNDTLRIATLNGQMKSQETIASPKVDLNLGFLASYLVSKSILGPKQNPALDAELINNLNRFESLLQSAEREASLEIVRLVSERNELFKKIIPPNGIVAKVKNWLTNRKIRTLSKRAISKKDSYLNREHLVNIANQYNEEAYRITRDHDGWYIYHVPPLDIGIITSGLVDLQSASMVVRLDQAELKRRLLEDNVPIYFISGCDLVERTRIGGLFTPKII